LSRDQGNYYSTAAAAGSLSQSKGGDDEVTVGVKRVLALRKSLAGWKEKKEKRISELVNSFSTSCHPGMDNTDRQRQEAQDMDFPLFSSLIRNPQLTKERQATMAGIPPVKKSTRLHPQSKV